jgi:aspartyl protease family protein
MGRTLLFAILAFGFFTSMLMRAASHTSARSGDEMFNERVKEAHLEANADGVASDRPSGGSSVADDGTVEIQRSPDGHFYADVQINGAPVHALVDTGATGMALSRDDARSAGVATSIGMPNVVGKGADGDVRGEYVTLDRVSVGQKTVEDVPAVVLNSGQLTLLGQSVLSKFDSVEIHGDTMVLR